MATEEKMPLFYQRDPSQKDGLDCVCKECRRKYRQKNKGKELARWKRYSSPGSKGRRRHLVRAKTRAKFGKASDHLCAFCEGRADEWHHLEYRWYAAIPLCRVHHHEFSVFKRPS